MIIIFIKRIIGKEVKQEIWLVKSDYHHIYIFKDFFLFTG